MITLAVISTALCAPFAMGGDVETARDEASATRCRMTDLGWEAWACQVDSAMTLAVAPDCPDDLCAFTLETLATARVDLPGFYELSTMVTVGSGLGFYACFGLDKEQNDFFAEQFPGAFPCPQSCRDNGFGTEALCEGTFTGVLHVPAGECALVRTFTDFGYNNSGTDLWIDFRVCRGEDGSVTALPAPWND